MNLKHGFAGAVLLVLFAGPMVQAQTPLALPPLKDTFAPTIGAPYVPKPLPYPTVEGPISSTPAEPIADSPAANPLTPNLWGQQPPTNSTLGGCCGPLGGNGPIGSDVYVRTGPSFIISNSAFAKALSNGYEVMGGGRSLLFNREGDKAWIIDLGVSYTFNDGHGGNIFHFMGAPVTIRGLDRTALGLGVGRDWYLLGAGNVGATQTNLSFGVDTGARWGTSHLDMNIVNTNNGYLRHQDVFAAGFLGMHLDLIVPMGGWAFLAGIRSEWSYSNTNFFLDGANSSLHDINLLFTMGVRY